MKLPLAYYGDAILRKKCLPVETITDEIRTLVKDMIETMNAEDGIGLAAPQVHIDLRLFITQAPVENPHPTSREDAWIDGPLKVYINPKILERHETVNMRNEACLSIPGLFGPVERPISIRIEAMNLEGEIFQEEIQGYPARCFLHENDHINGVLFIDRVHGKEREQLDPLLRNLKKKLGK